MNSQNKKVLLIDDSIIARMSLKRFLIERNYILLEAESGTQALDIIETQKPDLILTDHLMPEMNGLTFLKLIREKGITIPVIVVSANQQEITRQKFLELGVIGIIRKNSNKNELLSLVDKAFTQ